MSIDSIGNFLTIIRNAIMASKTLVVAPHSKMNKAIAQILKEEGFLAGFEEFTGEDGFKKLKLAIKYVAGESVIHEITRVSKPSRRIYTKIKNISPVIGGLGISILSTNKGVITDKKARGLDVFVGGEVICKVW